MKSLKILAVAAIAFWGFRLNAEVVDFDGFQLYDGAKTDERQTSLVLDSSGWEKEFVWHRYAITRRANLFKSDAIYKITFKAKVEGYGADAYLHLVVRAIDDNTGTADVARLNVKPTGGKVEDCDIVFYRS